MAEQHQRDPAPATPSAQMAAATVRVGEPGFLEGDPAWITSTLGDGSELALVSMGPGGALVRRSPEGISVRSRLYNYGAGSWCSTPLGTVLVDARSQRLHLVADRAATLLAGTGDERVGDPTWLPGTSWVLFFSERADREEPRRLCAVDLGTTRRVEVLETTGFLGDLACSHDGRHAALTHWPHATMPWDAAELWVLRLAASSGGISLVRAHRAEGGDRASCGQPVFVEDGSLAYVSESAGIWQPWLLDEGGCARRLSSRRAEFQRPRWLTCRWLADLGGAELGCAFLEGGRERVGVLGLDGSLGEIDQPCVRVDGIAARDGRLLWVGASTGAQGSVVLADRRAAPQVISSGPRAAAGSSEPERFALEHDDARLAGWYWAPMHGTGTSRGAPPLVLSVHPGPTGCSDASYAPNVALLNARGFAVASLDYSGSTGSGRQHRDALRGKLGVIEVNECAAAARALAAQGRADPAATFIRGTSAGGSTALLALGADAFCGAIAWYPPARFDGDDEGFEAGYLAALAGAEAPSRGPLARAGELRGAALVVQGLEDPVVRPGDTRELVDALRGTGLDVTLLELEGEGHGLRTATGRLEALEAELRFLAAHVRAPGPTDRYDGPEARSS